MEKPGVKKGVSAAREETVGLPPTCHARTIFSMLKIAGLSVEAKRFRVSERYFLPYQPESSSGKCQHADIAEPCFDEGWKKYSALYFL